MNAQTLLSGCALALLGTLGLIMAVHVVPSANRDYLIYILGTLSGAVTTVGAQRAINSLTTNGPNTTVAAPESEAAKS